MSLPRFFAGLVFTPPFWPGDEVRCERFAIARADAATDEQWCLTRTPIGVLELRTPRRDGPLTISLDPTRGDLARRLKTARSDQPLPRALGLHRRAAPPRVFDATAGLGRDALLLARLGCDVTAWEREPALAALLDDVVERCGYTERMRVHCGDAIAALQALTPEQRPDIVYLDPMFEHSGQSQVKKEMQVCRLIADDAGDLSVLLHAAFAAARERVVIKRHPHLQPLRGQPSHTIDGERVRFDVHVLAGE